jgi:glycine/D-amino acid oxidase-like deaminating enzyme
MRRRQVLIGLGGLASGWSLPGIARQRPLRVGVVGAGILGSSIGLHLALAGADVTIFEGVAPAAGATRNSYAWLNAFVGDPSYRDLRLSSLARWRWLDDQYSLGIRWGGYLNWGAGPDGQATVQANFDQIAQSASPALMQSADDLLRRAPYLTPGPIDAALFAPNDGHLDPEAVTLRLLEVARACGARLVCPGRVEGLSFRQGRLRAANTSMGRVELDRLVIAAGTATPAIAAMAGTEISLAHAPGILAHTRPVESFTHLTHEGPGESSFKQLGDGRIVAYDAPHPPDIPVHAGIRAMEMDYPSEALRREHGERMLCHLSRYCPRIQARDFARLTLGFRPMPLDDRPIVGALPSAPDVHIAVTHSGITLAAILGRLVASEVVDGTRAPVLHPYRPERFARV